MQFQSVFGAWKEDPLIQINLEYMKTMNRKGKNWKKMKCIVLGRGHVEDEILENFKENNSDD